MAVPGNALPTPAEPAETLRPKRAARDSLNTDTGRYGMQLVATGSNRAKLNLDIDLAMEVFQSLGSRPEPFRKALSQTRLQGALDPAQDSNAMLASLAAKGVSDSKTDCLNTVASLPPLQSALLRELAADSLLGPDARRPGLFSAAMKARLLARLEAEMGAAHGVSVETPSVQNALDKLREQNFLWRSQRGSYAVEDEQFLEWLAQEP